MSRRRLVARAAAPARWVRGAGGSESRGRRSGAGGSVGEGGRGAHGVRRAQCGSAPRLPRARRGDFRGARAAASRSVFRELKARLKYLVGFSFFFFLFSHLFLDAFILNNTPTSPPSPTRVPWNSVPRSHCGTLPSSGRGLRPGPAGAELDVPTAAVLGKGQHGGK